MRQLFHSDALILTTNQHHRRVKSKTRHQLATSLARFNRCDSEDVHLPPFNVSGAPKDLTNECSWLLHKQSRGFDCRGWSRLVLLLGTRGDAV